MARRRPAFLRRAIANEERRKAQAHADSGAAAAAFRWAAIGVAIVVGLAVMVGFTDRGTALAGWLGGFGWLTRPGPLGVSLADILIVAVVAAAIALYLLREWRRARR